MGNPERSFRYKHEKDLHLASGNGNEVCGAAEITGKSQLAGGKVCVPSSRVHDESQDKTERTRHKAERYG